ncbi:MAG: peptidase dimerization domain-containing protein [Candidatus Accumulibacter sp.]|jgi:di/tripeptidase|nr:peptidase dimerization domain-containing protein [Accumulibacter sp.]
MSKNRVFNAFLVASAAVLFSACGGGGGGGGGSGGSGSGSGPTGPTEPATLADYKITFLGPGGHSNGAYGAVNALHAAGRAELRLEELCEAAGIDFYVKEISGGNSVNAIASDGYLTVGLVKGDEAAFKAAIEQASDYAVRTEDKFRGRTPGETHPVQGNRIDTWVDSITKL